MNKHSGINAFGSFDSHFGILENKFSYVIDEKNIEKNISTIVINHMLCESLNIKKNMHIY